MRVQDFELLEMLRSQLQLRVMSSTPVFEGTAVASSHPSIASASTPVRAAFADDLYEAVRRRSMSLQGRRRVADAILDLALDVVGNGESLARQDRMALLTALAEPVSEATEEALRVLLRELAVALRSASAPPNRLSPAVHW
jgi:hypothetical protein